MANSSKPDAATIPLHFGVIVFPGFQALDAFGPLDIFNTLALLKPGAFTFSTLAASLEPVSTRYAGDPFPSPSFQQSITPTHTFDAPPPLDVLLVPGGIGTDGPGAPEAIEFIRKVYPSLKYLLTVCTGSVLAALAGVLDGRRATTNKVRYAVSTAQRTQVKWVAHARWVEDGNIWTSSGVTAGMDAAFAFIATVYGAEIADNLARVLEYERHQDPTWDPFAAAEGLAVE